VGETHSFKRHRSVCVRTCVYIGAHEVTTVF